MLGTLLQVNAAGGWRVVADIAAYEAAVDPNGGLIKMIVDLAFDDDGTLYVLQFATGPVFFTGPGELIRIAPDGSRIAASPRDLASAADFRLPRRPLSVAEESHAGGGILSWRLVECPPGAPSASLEGIQERHGRSDLRCAPT